MFMENKKILTKDGKLYFLQSLRGLAAGMVCVFHLVCLYWGHPSNLHTAFPWLHPFEVNIPVVTYILETVELCGINFGNLGVAVFFLISGFVISMSLSRNKLSSFFIKRVFRIYPTYIVGLSITCVYIYIYMDVTQNKGIPFKFSEIWIQASLLRDWFWQPTIDGISWTLEVEWKFYILAGLLFWWKCAYHPSTFFMMAVVMTLFNVCSYGYLPFLLQEHPWWYQKVWVVSFSAIFLQWMFAGTCLYHLYEKHWSVKSCCIILGVLYTSVLTSAYFSVIHESFYVFWLNYTIALFCFLCVYVLRDRITYNRWLEWLGAISYPLYVVHAVPGYVLESLMMERGWHPVLSLFAVLFNAFLFAIVLHFLIEKPSVRLGRVIAKRCRDISCGQNSVI